MIRKLCVVAIVLAFPNLACMAAAKHQEYTDPAAAMADPDFAVQGEYVGGGLAAQVVALSGGQFDVVVYQGGLPGDGWKRGDKKCSLKGSREGNVTKLSGDHYSGTITGGQMTLVAAKDQAKTELKPTQRKSPTLGAKPPAGAVVLFDGTSADRFERAKLVEGKYLLAGGTTKDKFGSYRLHLELLLPYMPTARGQSRANSGVYVHDCYEIQVLDSFGLEGRNNECGGFYSIKEPDVNMCLPPLVWQTYDIDFTAPVFDGKEKKVNGRITVRHNGVVIHDNLELPRHTPGRQPEGPAPRPIFLQWHGNQVYYQNIWVEEKK